MKHLYRSLILLYLCYPCLVKGNSGFVKLLLGVEPGQVVEGKDKSAIVLTQGYVGYKAFNYIQKTDSLGNLQWVVNLIAIQDTSVKFGVDVQADNNGNIFVVTNHKSGNGLLQKVTKIRDGSVLFTRQLANGDSLQPLPLRNYISTQDSGFLHVLENKVAHQFYLQKINSQAGVVWTQSIDAASFNGMLDTVAAFGLQYEMRLTKISEEKTAITGIGLNHTSNKYELFQTIYDHNTQTFQYNHIQLPEVIVSSTNRPILFEQAMTSSSNMRIALMNYDNSVPLNSYYISDLNINNGTKNIAYTFSDSSSNAHFPQRLYIDNAGNLFLLKPNSIYKKNAAGSLVWNRVLFPDRIISANVVQQDFVFMQNFTELSDSTFYIIGRGGRGLSGNICLCFGVLIKANKNGVIYERLIKGNVFTDDNKNCNYDNEPGLRQLLVEASTPAASFYTVTDSIGDYIIPVDIGNYTVKVFLNNSTYWQACTPSIQVNTLTDTTTADFAIQKQVECPYMDVDIATPYLRRCFDNTYNIHYSNFGTADAHDVYLKVSFDSLLSVRSSSIPWSNANGNTYTFFIGDVSSQAAGDFNISAYLSCDSTVPGQTHCVEAFIFPDSLCVPPDANWDGAIIQVSGKCIGDSIQLQIQNTGTGNMITPRRYYVLEGDFLRSAPNDFQLSHGQTETFTVPANGNTITLIAQQSDHYPYPGEAVISIEGCNGALQPGVVNHLPQNNSSPFIANNCTQNIGSYDPNFKAALPIGLDTLHFVTNTTPLEYIIHFQNTGTDTAFTVIVSDTISSLLNISTLRMGASSHHYTYQVENTGILKVSFNSINLPDSSKNETASQGYFKFTIQPKATLPDYSRINNKAAIYFDFNTGISTNVVFHTVKENLFSVISSVASNYKNLISLNIYPNPFHDYLNIALSEAGNKNESYDFKLYSSDGKLVFSRSFADALTLPATALTGNIYLYTISQNSTVVATGKLIRQ